MKLYGIGTDIIKVSRIKDALKKKTFLSRIYNVTEITKCKKTKKSIGCFAKRFAAKEAFSKALGTGLRGGISFKNIEILNDKMGKPYYYNSNNIKRIIYNRFKLKSYDLFLSISDETDYSVAFTVIQKK
jgi:holo-[acyl-carrier protein] synthase